MSLSRTFPVTKDTWVVGPESPGAGNGRGSTIVIGSWTYAPGQTSRNHGLFSIDCDFTGAISVSQALFRVRIDGSRCSGGPGNAVKIWAERLLEGFPEGDYDAECSWHTGNGTPGKSTYPGPGVTTAARAKYTGSPGAAETIEWDITAMVEAFRVELGTVKTGTLNIRLIAADASTGYDEDVEARRIAIRSTNGNPSGKPRLEVTLDDNHPPGPPTLLSPITRNLGSSDEGPALIDGLALTVSFRRNDQDSGDYITGSQIEVYTEGASEDDDGVVTGGTLVPGLLWLTKTDYFGQPSEGKHIVTGFLPGTTVRYRMRTRDRRNAWGRNVGIDDDHPHGWSSLEDGWVDLNHRPSAPTNLQVDPTDPTPDFSGRHNDPDSGSSVSAVETQVAKDTASGVEMLQNTTSFQPGDEGFDDTDYSTRNGDGAQSVGGGTAWTVGWSGSRAIADGESIRRRHRTVDQFGRVGLFNDPWASWTKVAPTVPGPLPPAGQRQASPAPNIGATYTELFDRMQIRAWTDQEGGTQLADTGEVTVTSALTATIPWGSVGTASDLQYGQTPWLERRVRKATSLEWTDYSPRLAMPIASLPRRPEVVIEDASLRDDGVYVVTSTTPRIRITYRSADNDTPSRRIVVLSTLAGVPVLTDDNSAPPPVEEYDVVAGSLTMESTYQLTVQHANDVGVLGTISDVLYLKVHQRPTVSLGTAPVAADPTPTMTWSTTFYGTAVADHDDILLAIENTEGDWEEIHSETLAGNPGTYTVPADVLPDDTDVRSYVTICDSDGSCTLVTPLTLVLDGAVTFTAGAATLSVDGTVTSDTPSDTFTRSVTDGWGSATTGGAWTAIGTQADYDVTGTTGTMSLPTVPTEKRAKLAGTSERDITVTITGKTDKLAVGGSQAFGIMAHGTSDELNRYVISLTMQTDATMRLNVAKVVAGAGTTLSDVLVSGLTHIAATDYKLKVKFTQVLISVSPDVYGTRIEAKAWLASGGEPGSYLVTVDDAAVALLGAGYIGLRAALSSTATNAPVLVTFDNLVTSIP